MGGGKFFLVFSVDDRKNTKTKLKGSVNLTVHLKLWLPLDVDKGSRSSERFLVSWFGRRRHTNRSGFRTARSKPRNRSTTSPLVINRPKTIDLAEKANPCLRIKNTSKNNEECNTIADVWLNSRSWGLTNRWTAKLFMNRIDLSKTQTLMVWRRLYMNTLGSYKILWMRP